MSATAATAHKRYKSTKSAADHDANYQQLLLGVVDLLTGDTPVTAYLDALARFRSYSARNALLIRAQNSTATQVASYKTWLSLGRQVNKGEKALKIYAPKIFAKPADTDTELPKKELRGFTLVSVFDVSQTTGDALPPVPTPLLPGEGSEAVWQVLNEMCIYLGFPAQVAELPPGVNGRTDFATHEICISSTLPDEHQVKTLAHELGHVLMHDPEHTNSPERPLAHVEFEAEAVAYLISKLYSLDTSAYSEPYIATWLGNSRSLEPADVLAIAASSGDRIRKAVQAFENFAELAEMPAAP